MRKICALLLSAVVGLGIVGCGEDKKPAPPANPPKTDAPKTDEKKPDAPAPKADEKKDK